MASQEELTNAMANPAAPYFGFSCPHEALDVALMDSIATTHYRRALRTFVSRHGSFLTERGSGGLVEVYQRWFDAPTDFETVWHVAFGKMREVLAEQQRPTTVGDVVLSAAQLGLRLCERGMTGRWTIGLESPARLRFDRWILPPCDRLDVTAETGALTFACSEGGTRRTMVLRAERDGWTTEGAPEGTVSIPTFETGARTIGVLLPGTPEGDANKEHELGTDDATRGRIWSGYRAAFKILDEYAPLYRPFVARLLRHLVPVTPMPGGYIGGGSLRDNPGTVKLPFEREVVGIAANLGHECAHQHYFLLRGAGRIDDGSDLSGYDSAFVEGPRDLPSVVLTYHAFANEALVLRTCEASGIPDPYAGDRAERIRFNLEPLEEILAKSKALTPLGQALWQPVAEQLGRAFR
jgi:HEXXH motif-containing protein